MKLSKLWNSFVALVQQQCDNFFLSGWLIMKSFALFLSSRQFASNPSQASMCTVFVHHISSFPSMFDGMFQYQSGKFNFLNIWSASFLCTNLHGPLLNSKDSKELHPTVFADLLLFCQSHMNHQLCTMTQLSIVILKLNQTSHEAMKGEAIE
jgi:hypothetical protein